MSNNDEEIHIVHYDPSWIGKFEEEKTVLEKTLGSWINEVFSMWEVPPYLD